MDFNLGFVAHAQKRGLHVDYGNLQSQEIPTTECILLQGSLYHFYPSHRTVIERLLKAATVKVIISEPIRTLSAHKNIFLRIFAKYITKTASGFHEKRFTREEMFQLANEFHAEKIVEAGTDMVIFFKKITIR